MYSIGLASGEYGGVNSTMCLFFLSNEMGAWVVVDVQVVPDHEPALPLEPVCELSNERAPT